MNNVGIVTLWGNFNYGNRLQNYAVERLVERMGFSPITLKVPPKRSFGMGLQRLKHEIYTKIKQPEMANRKKAFDRFNDEYLHGRPFNEEKRCKAFLCGSDQIWNYTFPEFSSRMFLDFASGRPASSISASFGVSSIPESLTETYRLCFDGLDRISVREDAAVRLVKELSGRDAVLLADPTMALTRDEWSSFLSEEKCPQVPYVVSYFLGRKPDDIEDKVLSELGDVQIVHLNDPADREFFSVDPRDFVGLIANAVFVLTDSFHAAVFSIVFDKRFAVFERDTKEKSMSSRIQTLLDVFSLEKNKVGRHASLGECSAGGERAGKTVEKKRGEVMDFLSLALEGVR